MSKRFLIYQKIDGTTGTVSDTKETSLEDWIEYAKRAFGGATREDRPIYMAIVREEWVE